MQPTEGYPLPPVSSGKFFSFIHLRHMSTAKVFILLALLAKYLFYWSYGHKDASRWCESGLNEFSPYFYYKLLGR